MTRNYLKGVLAIACLLVSFTMISGQKSAISCTPTVDHSDIARIRLIKLDGLKYITHGTHGYNNWENITIPIVAGTLYPIELKPVYIDQETIVYWKIWIDYNMDGDFNDLYEYACYGKGVGAISGTLRIPQDIWNGKTTIRVAISTEGYPQAPCDPIWNGEVEDYTVDISEGTQTIAKEMPRGGLCVHMPNHVDNDSKTTVKDADTAPITVNDIRDEATITEDVTHQINISPNPAFNYTLINYKQNYKPSDIDRIIVRDMSGSVLIDTKSSIINTSEYKLDTSNLMGGIYNVSVVKEGKAHTEKLIISK